MDGGPSQTERKGRDTPVIRQRAVIIAGFTVPVDGLAMWEPIKRHEPREFNKEGAACDTLKSKSLMGAILH